jgi:hypothetical protein
LPDAHVEAPTGGSVILAGVMLKLGTYGFLRFAMPLFPAAMAAATPFMLGLAVIGIVYGAMVAMVQPDLKKLVAYSSVSHLGFVMLGLFAVIRPGVEGAIYQMLNHGLSTGALFLLVGMIYERRHTGRSPDFGGLWKPIPRYAAVFLVVMFSSVGAAGPERLHRRVPDPASAPSGPSRTATVSRSGSCSAPSTCCGCSSASSSGRTPRGERDARGPAPARDRRARAGRRDDRDHGRLSGALPETMEPSVKALSRAWRSTSSAPVAVEDHAPADASAGGGVMEALALPAIDWLAVLPVWLDVAPRLVLLGSGSSSTTTRRSAGSR